jgi:acetyl esterase/lipase
MNRHRFVTYLLCIGAAFAARAYAADYTRTEDVVYGRKCGMALTLDVFTPKTGANGAAVVAVMSGGWFSSHDFIQPFLFEEYLSRGYTVFAVVHGSQPKFAIPDAIEDMHRSIRFIRHNAPRFKIDPGRIGITGASAGGHLSLMIGMAGNQGDANATDAVDRDSSRVQAVACFFPPTDFLNYGKPDRTVLKALKDELWQFRAPFDFVEFNPATKRLELITSETRRLDICRDISPIAHVSSDDPPTLIFHGDADNLVPIEQSERLIEKLKAAGVTAELQRRPGAGHGWLPTDMAKDVKRIADWFDKYLAKPAPTTPAPTTRPANQEE